MKNNIFISKYVLACAISIVIVLVGFIALKSLPVEQYPSIAPPMVRVTTTYTGADPNNIMKSVIQPLEENINGVEGMTYMTSTASSTGDVQILVYFEQGTDADMATAEPRHPHHRPSACGCHKSGCAGEQDAEQHAANRGTEEHRRQIRC